MDSASQQIEPSGETPLLEVIDVVLPPTAPAFTRADAISIVLAAFLHAGILAAFLAPDRRFGIGGVELEALGIEIVTVAPALQARSTARGRGAASADAQVSEQDGDSEPLAEQAATRDSRRDEKPVPSDAASPPADLVVRDWIEQPRPADAPATEPIIARTKSDGAAPETPEQLRPSQTDEPSSAIDSRSASEVLAQFRGGAAARGHEQMATLDTSMAAARAGQRDTYKEAIVRAIMANPPRNATGRSGVVKLEFVVKPDGSIADVRVATSSNVRPLDDLAVAALRALRLPPPPPELVRNRLTYDQVFTFK